MQISVPKPTGGFAAPTNSPGHLATRTAAGDITKHARRPVWQQNYGQNISRPSVVPLS
jgi:hypothetical protein